MPYASIPFPSDTASTPEKPQKRTSASMNTEYSSPAATFQTLNEGSVSTSTRSLPHTKRGCTFPCNPSP